MLIGLAINPHFYNHAEDIERIRNDFGLKEKKFTVLLTGGGDGGGKIYPIVKEILKENLDVQIVVVCGRNKILKEKLSKLPVVALDYTNRMPELMSIADLVVTKAGPGTIEECITKGLPIIITSYIFGQEKANIAYAKERTRAYYEKNSGKVVGLIKKELMSAQGKLKRIPKEDAAVYKIADLLKGLLS